jgi:hypothetical protein
MKEFRFATNLKTPIINCIFGSANRMSDWRATELVRIISCLYKREISFQLENIVAYQDLLNEIKG